MSDRLTDEDLDAMRARGDSLVAPGSAELPDAALAVLADHDILIAEVRRLRQWKADALPVLDGLRELGRALDLPIGQRITGPAALKAVERLREQRREALSLANVRVAQWERESSTPGVWAVDIRDALEADDA